ncbi:hypothetical protein ACFC1U_11430 [Bacillus subtilis]|uniref:hypothetical protein n=1 Tax=Bacillus subtilis group TaxID=653685 RepID=UPI0011CAE369|nr:MULTISPECIES: hypothetical protein [Bacillus subtilis group]MBU8842279.1 hypothetical protein [Alkalicoccobacillus gibsonii]MCY7965004.1 hypothetical protein [Bacillus inaquosorum]TXK63255.1 hypothetical protein FVD40_02630 [Bacillus subtilis]UVB74197.1 hypothetical protein LXE94_13300 [Bacillus subtilis]
MMVHFVHKPATALEVRKWCAMIRNNSEFYLLWDIHADKFREENMNGRKSNGHKQLAR